jgi:hypothetical protein
MDEPDNEALRRAAAEARARAQQMRARCAELQAADEARRERIRRSTELYEAEILARRAR